MIAIVGKKAIFILLFLRIESRLLLLLLFLLYRAADQPTDRPIVRVSESDLPSKERIYSICCDPFLGPLSIYCTTDYRQKKVFYRLLHFVTRKVFNNISFSINNHAFNITTSSNKPITCSFFLRQDVSFPFLAPTRHFPL